MQSDAGGRPLNAIFIGGTGRSGTTIAAKMLGEHSQIFTYPLETRFIIDPDGLIELVTALSVNWSPYIGGKAVKRFKTMMDALAKDRSQIQRVLQYAFKKAKIFPQQYAGLQLAKLMGHAEYRRVVDTFIRRLTDAEFSGYWCGTDAWTFNPSIISPRRFQREEIVSLAAQLVEDLFGLASAKHNKKYYVDHTPYNILHADFLKELFPSLKLVHVYRDARDVICSYKTKQWGGNRIEEIVYRLGQIYRRWNEQKEKLPPENYYELKFEAVIQNPEREMQALSTFLGIPYEEKVIDIDLSKGNIGRWKEDLTMDEQALIRDRLGWVLEQYNYD